jgi:hypothetical protein
MSCTVRTGPVASGPLRSSAGQCARSWLPTSVASRRSTPVFCNQECGASLGLKGVGTKRGPAGLALVLWIAIAAPGCWGDSPSGPHTAPSPTPTAKPTPTPYPARSPCGTEPPRLLEPPEGAIVAGTITLSAELLEDPCFIAATAFFSVIDAAGNLTFTGCDNDIPARVRWDTTGVSNGRYAIRVQRGCHCAPACAELGGPVHVTVKNP